MSKKRRQRRRRPARSKGESGRPKDRGTTPRPAVSAPRGDREAPGDVTITDRRCHKFDALAKRALETWQGQNPDVRISTDPGAHLCMEYLEPVAGPERTMKVGQVLILGCSGDPVGEAEIFVRARASA